MLKLIGLILILAGASHWVLPMIEQESFLANMIGDGAQWAAIGGLGLGVIVMVLGFRSGKSDKKKK